MRKMRIEKNDLIVYKGDKTSMSEVKRNPSFARVKVITFDENGEYQNFILELLPSKQSLSVIPLYVNEISTSEETLNLLGFKKDDPFFSFGNLILALLGRVEVDYKVNYSNSLVRGVNIEYKSDKSPVCFRIIKTKESIDDPKYLENGVFNHEAFNSDFEIVENINDILPVFLIESDSTENQIINLLGNSFLKKMSF